MKFEEKKRDRKPDLEGHMWNALRVDDPIQCNKAPCQNKDFSAKGALKLHIKSQNKKQHSFKCKYCYFGTESRDYYIEHRIRQHGVRMRNKETKDPIIYHCSKCGKICKEPASRRKHIQRGMCKVAKTVPCTGSARKFKTVKGRDLHFSHHHYPEARVWKCSQCAKQTSSYSSYVNHQKWHRGYNSKVRQIKAREKCREQGQLKAYANHLERRKPKSPRQGDPDYVNPAAKSAQAKICRSPRIQREKEKSKGKKKDSKGKE